VCGVVRVPMGVVVCVVVVRHAMDNMLWGRRAATVMLTIW
jgi:hypothetical protein